MSQQTARSCGLLSPVSGCCHRTFSFVLVCAVCAYDAAACCAMLTCASKKRLLDCWRVAISPPLFHVTITAFLDALVDCRLQRRHVGVSALVCLSLHWDCSVVEAFGCKSGANGHVSFFWDLTTLHGGCVRLRGRWEGDGVTGVVASVLFLSVFVLWWGLSVTGCLCVPLCLVTIVASSSFFDQAVRDSLY
ncbi:hypothetical protein TcCL_Unassigned05314 [Trypanosoma cruzi]|nr:hypothetical protein TcCL_Unassigned05314 [Trypanosoma cruzi]